MLLAPVDKLAEKLEFKDLDVGQRTNLKRPHNLRPASTTNLKMCYISLLSASCLLFILFLSHSIDICHSALLTNLYSKKLSELPNFANRFLILPSTHQTQRDPSQPFALPNTDTNESAQKQPQPLAQALVSNWKPTQVPASQLSGPPSRPRSTNGSHSPAIGMDTSKLLGELAQENISTEFPNPNTNNLGHEITKILKKFFLHGYDKRVRPNYSGPPALVNVSFHIIGISSVDEVQMDFTTDFYFRQKWFDPRLEFDPVGEVDELCVGAEFAEKIWLPDTFFANEKTATFHKATTENTFIRIARNGRVYRSIRLTVTCSCPMDLQYFPMDRQRCKIEIESYGYNTRDIDYRWERGDASVSLNTKIELPQFKILGFKMGQELQNLSSGDYIRLYCEIHFVRSMGYYLIQIYIPASLIVMISWVSFWLHRNATPARVALGVTTVLTMTTLMSSTNAALPKISYIKSIDVFLGTCFVMVFASLLEYASVGYIGKRIAMKRKRLQDLQQMQQHHQKVCVAAAASASAAAAAAAAQESAGAKFSSTTRSDQNGLFVTTSGPTEIQTLHRRMNSNVKLLDNDGTRTLDRNQLGSSSSQANEPGAGQRSAIKVLIGNNNNNKGAYADTPNPVKRSQNIATKQSNTNMVGLGNFARQGNHPGPATNSAPPLPQIALPAVNTSSEFEVSQTHDMIKICGLTPSAIDKHSRVVFPICFVCFNLMYWIIYGHISQQIEDKGPPLIPFVKT